MKTMMMSAISALALMFTALTAQAASYDPAAWVGGGFGLSVPNESNTSSRTIAGINGGAKIGTEYGIGAYYLTSHKDESANGVTLPWNFDLYGVMAAYFFEGEAKGVYLGGMLGTSKVGTRVGGNDLTTSPMHWGLVAGYDAMLMDHFSLGGEIHYISVSSASATVGGATINTDAFGTLDFLVSAKLWF